MSKYPKLITQDVLKKSECISDEETQQDIFDTQQEIELLEKEVEGLGLVAKSTIGTPDGRMANFRYQSKQIGLNERRDFVKFLERLTEARLQNENENENN